MNFNEHAVLYAVANMAPTMRLDTGVSQDGSGRLQDFPVPFTAAIQTLKAATAAEATRDAAVMVTLTKLLELGGADAAPIVAAIKLESEKTRSLVEQRLAEEMAALRQANDAEVAGLQAELARLTAPTA